MIGLLTLLERKQSMSIHTEKKNAVAFVREAQATDNVIIDNDYVTVIVTGYEDDEIWGYTANLFLLNKTDKTVMFSVDDASVNGFMADPFLCNFCFCRKNVHLVLWHGLIQL